MRVVVACCLAVALVLTMASCNKKSDEKSPTDPAAGEVEAQAGDAALAGGDVAAANSHYKTALSKDSQSPHANIGAAVTEIALLQSDPTVDSLLTFVGPAANSVRVASPMQAMSRLALLPQQQLDPVSAGRAVSRILYRSMVDPTFAAWYQIVVR